MVISVDAYVFGFLFLLPYYIAAYAFSGEIVSYRRYLLVASDSPSTKLEVTTIAGASVACTMKAYHEIYCIFGGRDAEVLTISSPGEVEREHVP